LFYLRATTLPNVPAWSLNDFLHILLHYTVQFTLLSRRKEKQKPGELQHLCCCMIHDFQG